MKGNAIVLGAAGFVGRHISRALAADDWRVTGIGHGTWAQDERRAWGLADWHPVDVSADALLTYAGEPDILVQCAGSGSVPFSMSHPKQDFDRSVGSTLTALEFIRVHAPKCRFVLPSSAAIYGNVQTMPIAVGAPKMPQSPYGVHKIIAEDLCRSYCRTFEISGAIVRLFSVYGNGLRKQLLWDACVKLKGGMANFAGTGDEERDWLHVEDAATLLIAAGEHARPNCPIVNGGTGETVSVRRVIEQINTAMGNRSKILFTGARREGDPDVYQADISEALQWDWRPKQNLRTGLADYVAWFEADAK